MMHFREGLAPIALCSMLWVGAPVLAQETELPETEPSPPQQEAQVLDTPALNMPSGLPTLPPREAFSGILERPLFNADRRPAVDAGDDQALTSATELREQWKLTGIVMVGDEVRAMLQHRDGDRHLTMIPGMPLDATWMLEEINPDSVIMGSGEEQIRLELMTPRDTKPVLTAEKGVTERSEQGNTDEQSRQPDTRESEPRRLRQSTEVSDE
ncbi:hypothetical protein GCM10009104_18040 [Marinobacterium maritimum]|uniref:General secretion pathway protein N n=1 Tax=Marinobacterium maritimum TaxID=500162 RepID=A0ABN1I634_9GAMM